MNHVSPNKGQLPLVLFMKLNSPESKIIFPSNGGLPAAGRGGSPPSGEKTGWVLQSNSIDLKSKGGIIIPPLWCQVYN